MIAIEPINIGVVPNDGTGDTVRSAFTKVNQNFTSIADGAVLSVNGESGGAIELPASGIPFSTVLAPGAGAAVPTRDVADKLSEQLSVLDYGGAADYAGAGAGTGTENTAPCVLIADVWGPNGIIIHFPFKGTGKYRFGGSLQNYEIMVACVIDADPGVTFYFDVFPGYDVAVAKIRCVRPINCVSLDFNYKFVLGARNAIQAVEKPQYLSGDQFDRSTISPVQTNTSELQPLKVAWNAGDAFSADATYTLPSARSIAFAGLAGDGFFHMGMRNVALGDELTVSFAGAVATAQFVCMVRATGGYSGVYFEALDATATLITFRKNIGAGAAQSPIDYLGRNSHASYAAYNSHVTLRATGFNPVTGISTFDVLFNGMVVYQGFVNGVIFQAGYGLYGQNGVGGTINNWTITRGKDAGGYGLCSVLVIGDSKTAPRWDCWPNYLQQYLEATAGMRVVNVWNYAISGGNSQSQLANLQALGVPGTPGGPSCPVPPTVCVIDIGTNDVQGAVDVNGFTLSGIQSMVTLVLAAAPNCKIVLCDFSLWYGQAQNGGIGQGAQNYAGGSSYRTAIARFAAENGYAVIDWHEVIGPVYSGFDNSAASNIYPAIPQCLPPVQDNIHPGSWAARLQGFHAARFIAGLIAAKPGLALAWSVVPGTAYVDGWGIYAQQPLRWRTDRDGFVHLSGVVTLGTTADGTIALNLPQNLWPETTVRTTLTLDSGGAARFELSPIDGGLRIYNKTAAGGVDAFFDSFPVYKPANGLP